MILGDQASHHPIAGPLYPIGISTSSALVSEPQARALSLLGFGCIARYACIVGGTRSGKTFSIVTAIVLRALVASNSRHAILRFRGNAARAAISLDTLPTVLRINFPGVRCEEHRQDGYFEFENGSRIWVGGLDDKDRVEKILGLEFVTVFLNEASQIPYQSALVAFTRLAQVSSGLTQRGFVDLNPVGKGHWTNRLFGEHKDPVSRMALADPSQYVRGFVNPRDNAHNLSPEFLASLEGMPGKQRKRFYEGVYVDELEGALWTYDSIERNRREVDIQSLQRIVVGVDPSGAASDSDELRDEIGIIVAGRGRDGHGYILADRSLRGSPRQWARAVCHAYHEFQADVIVAEQNFGGAMVKSTIAAADPNVPVSLVTASRGKAVRAEPISTLYEEDKIHHVGMFSVLEDQLCGFSNAGYMGEGSPDHADAMVWALSSLMLGSTPVARTGTFRMG